MLRWLYGDATHALTIPRVRSLIMSRDRPRRNRRLSEKLLLTAIGIATGIGFVATFVLGYAVWRLDQVQRFEVHDVLTCLLYTSPSPRDLSTSRMPSSA